MDPQLETLYQQLERQREELLGAIRQLDFQQHTRSINGKWSLNEILAHLITSERMSLSYLKKKSNAIHQVGDTGLFEEIKMLLLKMSQRIPLRYKAPKIVKQNTPQLSFAEIEKSWTELRVDLFNFIQTLDAAHTKRKIYKHPVAGRLNIKQAMAFFREHITHHLPQIKRLLS